MKFLAIAFMMILSSSNTFAAYGNDNDLEVNKSSHELSISQESVDQAVNNSDNAMDL